MSGILVRVRAGSRTPLMSAMNLMGQGAEMCREVVLEGSVEIGVVFSARCQTAVYHDQEAGVVIVAYGFVLSGGSNLHRLSALELAAIFRNKGVGGFFDCDGAFQLVLFDESEQMLHVVNDHVGSLPLFFCEGSGEVAIAPNSAAVLALSGESGVVDSLGALQLLNNGYPFGAATLRAGVRRLRPARHMAFDLRSRKLRVVAYWDMRCHAGRRLSGDAAADALFASIVTAQKATASLGAPRVALALTGGLDSRVVLGTLPRVGGLEVEALTWGAIGDLPRSDPGIARAMARSQGVPFKFLDYSSARLPENFASWTSDGEGLSDNLGYYAAGANFLAERGSYPHVLLTGDHLIGLAGLPESVPEALGTVLRIPPLGLLPHLEGVIERSLRGEVASLYWSSVHAILQSCPSEKPKDIQDYLFFHIYSHGWLCSPGFYKEPAILPFRPLMLAPVRDIAGLIGDAERADKAVLVRMLRRHLPELATFPVCSAMSVIDWSHDMRRVPSVRALFEEYTRPERVEATPLGEWMNVDAYRDLRHRFFGEQPRPVSRRPSAINAVVGIRRFLARNRWSNRAARWIQAAFWNRLAGGTYLQEQGMAYRFMARAAILARLQENVEAGAEGLEASGRTAR